MSWTPTKALPFVDCFVWIECANAPFPLLLLVQRQPPLPPPLPLACAAALISTFGCPLIPLSDGPRFSTSCEHSGPFFATAAPRHVIFRRMTRRAPQVLPRVDRSVLHLHRRRILRVLTGRRAWLLLSRLLYLLALCFVPHCVSRRCRQGSPHARKASRLLEPSARRLTFRRYWVKCNLWIFIFGWVGNYFWTHYFYIVLRAKYAALNARHTLAP